MVTMVWSWLYYIDSAIHLVVPMRLVVYRIPKSVGLVNEALHHVV